VIVAEKIKTVPPETEQDLVAGVKEIIISEIDVEVSKEATVEKQPTNSVDLMDEIGRSLVLDEDEPKQVKLK